MHIFQIRVVSAFRSGMDSRKNSTTDAGALGRSASKRTPHMHPNAAAATASTSADVIKDAANDKKNSAHNETPVWTRNFCPLADTRNFNKTLSSLSNLWLFSFFSISLNIFLFYGREEKKKKMIFFWLSHS